MVMKMKSEYRDRDWLYEEYITKNRTMTEIGNECSVTPMTIQNWLDKHQIPTRPRGIHKGGVRGKPRKREATITIPLKEYHRLLKLEYTQRNGE